MFVLAIGALPGHAKEENDTYCCYVRRLTSIVLEELMPWPINSRNLLPCTVMTSRQRSFHQRVGCMETQYPSNAWTITPQFKEYYKVY